MKITEKKLLHVFETLLERFGERVVDEPATIGIPDERDEIDESVYDGLDEEEQLDESCRHGHNHRFEICREFSLSLGGGQSDVTQCNVCREPLTFRVQLSSARTSSSPHSITDDELEYSNESD